MKNYNKIENEIISTVLTSSFYNNKSVVYILKKGNGKIMYLRGLIDYTYHISKKQNGVLITDGNKGAALVTYPFRKQKFNFTTLIESIKVVYNAFGVGGFRKVVKRENYIKQLHPQHDFLYLWFIGVLPDEQGKGIISNLLKKVLKISEHQGLSVYLETSTKENLPFYQKHGFFIYKEWLDKQSRILLYFLRKDVYKVKRAINKIPH